MLVTRLSTAPIRGVGGWCHPQARQKFIQSTCRPTAQTLSLIGETTAGPADSSWTKPQRLRAVLEGIGLSADHDRPGRVKVQPDLSFPGRQNIFVVGDTACVREAGRQIPGLAPAAKQMGNYVARQIVARIEGRSLPPFQYRHQGNLTTIGRRAAVVELGSIRLKGAVGWLFWSVVHIFFLIGLRNRLVVAMTWLWSYITFQRGARLITSVPPPGSD